MQRCVGNGGIDYYFAISTVEGVEFSTPRFGRFATQKRFPVPTECGTRWSPVPVGKQS